MAGKLYCEVTRNSNRGRQNLEKTFKGYTLNITRRGGAPECEGDGAKVTKPGTPSVHQLTVLNQIDGPTHSPSRPLT